MRYFARTLFDYLQMYAANGVFHSVCGKSNGFGYNYHRIRYE